jgi:multicomponent Na+:H+ antiporter subunit D
MMNNFVVLPLVIPLLSGLLMALLRKNVRVQRWLSILSVLLTFTVSYHLLQTVKAEGIQILEIGGWTAPFGIVLVVDLISALLLMTTSVVSFACIIYAFKSIGAEREKFYFYSLIQFLLTGINGSFITGDLFNLYVCFEVMLLASYVLLSLGGGRVQLREGIKYIVINTLSSTFFLLGIAYLYAVVGTLNLAHLSVRVAEAGQTGLMTTIAVLFLIVFGIKAALFLFFWLPGAYSAPPAAISAIFAALLTKVGIYTIFRLYTLVFYHQPHITHTLIAVMAGLTMLLGGIGAIGQWDIRKILGYNVIIGVGFVISGLAVFTSAAVAGAIYYVIHDMVTKALLFLLGGTMISIVGTGKLKEISGLIRNHPSLGWMFFITTLALAGVPPLSGFIGKVLIIKEGLSKGVFQAGFYWLAGIGLLSSLMILYSLMKIFINGFWGETQLSKEMEKGTTQGLLFPCVFLTAVCVFLGLGAELLYPYIESASQSLIDPHSYIQAVLSEVV